MDGPPATQRCMHTPAKLNYFKLIQRHSETSLITGGKMISRKYHTVFHFPDFRNELDARSDGIFLVVLGAQA